MEYLTVCSNCRHEHYYTDSRPDKCHSCNSELVGNNYPVALLNEFASGIDVISEKLNLSFDEALDFLIHNLRQKLSILSVKPTVSQNLVDELVKPTVSQNLVDDPAISDLLQPPK
ncbi:hypothetical protein NIES4074_61310 (plasmid) [Cylindrospermum sp. NIES-4074]|nr:hypothetical protein NIES4074_61310 [Cylindrospermum sp. NIES-4074]